MSKNFKRNNPHSGFSNVGFLSGIRKEITNRFEKAEIAGMGILLFIFLMFPLAIFLAGVAAFFGFRYWKKNKKRR